MISVIEKIEALHQRLERARQLLTDDKVDPVLGMTEHYVVQWSNGSGFYLANGTCSCPDSQERSELTKGLCKHKLATLLYQETHEENGQ